jgi:hypothetical protein
VKISYTKFVNEYDPISVSWEHDHNNILLELSEPMLIDEQAANDSYPRVGIKTKMRSLTWFGLSKPRIIALFNSRVAEHLALFFRDRQAC